MPRKISGTFLLSIYLAVIPAWAGLNYWSPIGPDGGRIDVLEAGPQQNGVVYAGYWGGVFKSSDRGTNWSWASRGLKGSAVLSLAVAPSNRSRVYAGTFEGVFVSRDGAMTWTGNTLKDRGVLSLAVDPRDANRVWAGTWKGLYWSQDAGAHWSLVDSELIACVVALAFDPVHPSTLYAAVGRLGDFGVDGVVKSTDAGATWMLGLGLEDVYPWPDNVRLAVDPTEPEVVYVSFRKFPEPGTRPDITYRSTDGAGHWTPTIAEFPLAVDRKGMVYAGMWRSSDHGMTLQRMAVPPEPIASYAVSAAADGTLWAASERSGIFRSRDRGVTWQVSSKGLDATGVESIAVDPDTPRVIYAGANELGLRKTLSSGQHWRPIDTGLPDDVHGFRHLLALDPQQPQTLYFTWYSETDGFARSDDGGSHWILLPNTPASITTNIYQLLVDPAGVIYFVGEGAAAYTCKLARSDDYGVTRRCIQPDVYISYLSVTQLALDPYHPGTLWLLDWLDLLWKSSDYGSTWIRVHPKGLEDAGDPYVMLFDPVQPGRLYLGTEYSIPGDRPERLWRSDDNGLTWRAWGRGIPAMSRITGLLNDPKEPSILYAVVEHFQAPSAAADERSGVYWSRDGGRTFTGLRDGLPSPVFQLVLDPKDPHKLYAATEWNGVYTFTRPK